MQVDVPLRESDVHKLCSCLEGGVHYLSRKFRCIAAIWVSGNGGGDVIFKKIMLFISVWWWRDPHELEGLETFQIEFGVFGGCYCYCR